MAVKPRYNNFEKKLVPGVVIVSNLPKDMSDGGIYRFFEDFGHVIHVETFVSEQVVKVKQRIYSTNDSDGKTNQPVKSKVREVRSAKITYEDFKNALAAQREVDGKEVMGSKVRVEIQKK